MQHLGDVTKIDGHKVPIVDCLIGGSPCQDLSVAGKRKGMLHADKGDDETTRSGLFMEQIRLIKEMRESDRQRADRRANEPIRPRYMVWENVPGAFSSNKGEDFRVVLEEVARISEADVSIPGPEKGKWSNSGCVIGDTWSVAWRVFDAQYWGVPQRRKRICLVADFDGHTAAEIVFNEIEQFGCTDSGDTKSFIGDFGDECRSEVQPEPESLSGNTEQSRETREETSAHASGSSGAGDMAFTMQDREGCAGGGKGFLLQPDRSASLRTNNFQTLFQPTDLVMYTREFGGKVTENPTTSPTLEAAMGHDIRSTKFAKDQVHDPLTATDYKEPGIVAYPESTYWDGSQVAGTLTANNAGGCQRMPDKDNFNCVIERYPNLQPTTGSLMASGYDKLGTQEAPNGMYVVGETKAVDLTNMTESETNGAIQASMEHNIHSNNVVRVRYIVRRLTPLECERLQGFPDHWTDIGDWVDTDGKTRKLSDSHRYKALGNSIALPSWKWVLKRMCANYERPATLASLFDGIGGFPKIWEDINGKGTCLWASEIEEFPMAVTRKRFE